MEPEKCHRFPLAAFFLMAVTQLASFERFTSTVSKPHLGQHTRLHPECSGQALQDAFSAGSKA
jgi:hypothetical protein